MRKYLFMLSLLFPLVAMAINPTVPSGGGGAIGPTTDVVANSISLTGSGGNSVIMSLATSLCYDGASCVTQSYWDGTQLYVTAGTSASNIDLDVGGSSILNLNNSTAILYRPLKLAGGTPGLVEDGSGNTRLNLGTGPSLYEDADVATATAAAHEFKLLNARSTTGAFLFQLDNGSSSANSVFDVDKAGNIVFPAANPSLYTGTNASVGQRRIALNTSGIVGNAFNGNVTDVSGNIANTFGNITTLTATTDYIAGFCAGDASSCSSANAVILIDKFGDIIPSGNGHKLGNIGGTTTFNSTYTTNLTFGVNGGAASMGWASSTETYFTNSGTLYLIPSAGFWTTTYLGEPASTKSFQGVYSKTQQLYPLLTAGSASTGITCAAGVELQRVGIAGDATHNSQDCICVNHSGTFKWYNTLAPTDTTGTTTACPVTP